MAGHQNEALLFGERDEVVALGAARGHGLFHQYVLAGFEAGFGHPVVLPDRRRDHHPRPAWFP